MSQPLPSLSRKYARRTSDMPAIRTRYAVKKAYYFLSGLLFVLTLCVLILFSHEESIGRFADSLSMYRTKFLIFIGVLALLALGTRLRASFCVICSLFRWPTQLDYRDFCHGCGASLFQFEDYSNQKMEVSQTGDVNQWLLDKAKSDTTEAIDMLLDKGANVNHANKYGNTPLMNAALTGHPDMIRHLIAKGANPEATNNYGLTALMLAADKNQVESVKALLAAGVATDTTSNDGRTALDIAKGHHFNDLAALLEG